jgi:hypothetical protein
MRSAPPHWLTAARKQYRRALNDWCRAVIKVHGTASRPRSEDHLDALDEAERAKDRVRRTKRALTTEELRGARDTWLRQAIERLHRARDGACPYHPSDGELAKGWRLGLERAIRDLERIDEVPRHQRPQDNRR